MAKNPFEDSGIPNKPIIVKLDNDYYLNPAFIASICYIPDNAKPWRIRAIDKRYTDLTEKQWKVFKQYLDIRTVLFETDLKYDKVYTEVERVYATRYDCKEENK